MNCLGIIGNVTRKIVEFGVKNSTTILTVTAVVGVGATAVSTGKAVIEARDTIKAHEMDEELKCERIEQVDGVETSHLVYYRERTKWEKVRLTWKSFILPIFLGGTTIACIVGSNTISTRRNLALAAAYSMSEEAAKEFRDKVAETIGDRKVDKIDHAIAQDHMEKTPVPEEDYIIHTGNGGQLCYDWWSGRYFRSSQTEIEKREVMLNKRIARTKDKVKVNDFYELLGLPTLPLGEEFGWKYDPTFDNGDVTIHFKKLPSSSNTGEPCLEVRINPELLHVYI